MQVIHDNTNSSFPGEDSPRSCTIDPFLRDLLTSKSKKKRPGMILDGLVLETISGNPIHIPDCDQFTHLQFRRFAGCPVCNLHLQSFSRRHKEIASASIREVVVFHSSAQELIVHAGDLPFEVIADPEKQLYVEFEVESSPRALLSPWAWLPVLRAVLHSLWEIAWKGRPVPPVNPHGGSLGLPADFLIGPDGHIIACKYGLNADDQWSVDDVLEIARSKPAIRIATRGRTVYE